MRGFPVAAAVLAVASTLRPELALGFLSSTTPGSRPKHQLTLRRRPLPAAYTTATAITATTMMVAAPRGGGAGSKSLIDSIFGSPRAGVAKPGGARKEGQGAALVRQYFELWNERRMAEAVDLFTEDCSYEDTLYSGSFEGKDALRKYVHDMMVHVMRHSEAAE